MYRYWRVGDIQILEFDFDRPWPKRFDVWFHHLPYGQDHCGLFFGVVLWGRKFELNFYDRRHWNQEAGRYYTDEEQKQISEAYMDELVAESERLKLYDGPGAS